MLISLLLQAKFISISMDEATAVDNTHLLGMHIYWMSSWKRQTAFVALAEISAAPDAPYLLSLALALLASNCGIQGKALAQKLVCCATDGAAVFSGLRAGLIALLRKQHAPFVMPMNCMAHRTQLCVSILSDVPLVSRIQRLLKGMYAYFSRGAKRLNELRDFA